MASHGLRCAVNCSICIYNVYSIHLSLQRPFLDGNERNVQIGTWATNSTQITNEPIQFVARIISEPAKFPRFITIVGGSQTRCIHSLKVMWMKLWNPFMVMLMIWDPMWSHSIRQSVRPSNQLGGQRKRAMTYDFIQIHCFKVTVDPVACICSGSIFILFFFVLFGRKDTARHGTAQGDRELTCLNSTWVWKS